MAVGAKRFRFKTNAIILVIILIIFVILAILFIKHYGNEGFATVNTCPPNSNWFIGPNGTSGCCSGAVNPKSRRCLGEVVCSFSANPTDGSDTCAAVMKKEIAGVTARICPPSMPNLIAPSGNIVAPTGCCAVPLDSSGKCPTGASWCSTAIQSTVNIKNGDLGCRERQFYEQLTCPSTNYVKSGPTWQQSYGRYAEFCTHQPTMTMCLPDLEFAQLVADGKLTGTAAANNSVLRCSVHQQYYEKGTLTRAQVVFPQ